MITRIKNKIKHLFKTKEKTLEPPALPAPTEKESRLIETFRKKISSLPPLEFTKENSTSHKWLRRLNEMRQNILNKDPRNFTRWPDVAVTMYTEAPVLELEHLKNLPSWSTWEKALTENPAGNPPEYKAYPTSGGNLIHHAYHLSQLVEQHRISIPNMQYIFEFGGGYGSMARLFFQLGFKGTYVIFDLPEFSALQEYFLSSINLPIKIHTAPTQESNSVVLLSDISKLTKQLQGAHPNIFIATWSTSESPVKLRKKIENFARNSKHQLIGYQNLFGGIDNLSYYADMQKRENSYTWIDREIEHFKGNHYLIGKKK